MKSHLSHLRNALISFAAGCMPAYNSIDFALTPDGAFPTIRTARQRSDELLQYLQKNAIEATTIHHGLWSFKTRQWQGIRPDHWLLENGAGRLFLIVVPPGTKLDLNRLSSVMGLGGGQLSVVSDRIVKRILKIDREFLSVLSVVNDTTSSVTVAIDCSLMKEDALGLHALTQLRTVIMCPKQLASFLQSVEHAPIYLSASGPPTNGSIRI